jgi:hypothetical protein
MCWERMPIAPLIDDLVAVGDRTVAAIQRYFQFSKSIEVRCPWHDGSDPGILQMVRERHRERRDR